MIASGPSSSSPARSGPAPLRERRRRQTAQEIQIAALDLIAERGLAAVTTEMIAARAGVSPRTFFNYYTNKESAAVGVPPDFSQTAIDHFLSSDRPLAEALAVLVEEQIAGVAARREIVLRLFPVAQANPQLLVLMNDVLARHWDALTGLLQRKMPGMTAEDAGLMADLLLATIRNAMRLWLTQDSARIDRMAEQALKRLIRVAGLVAEAGEAGE